MKELATNGKRQRKNFFSSRVVQKWNLLLTEVKMAPSLDSFKNRLDERIMRLDIPSFSRNWQFVFNVYDIYVP